MGLIFFFIFFFKRGSRKRDTGLRSVITLSSYVSAFLSRKQRQSEVKSVCAKSAVLVAYFLPKPPVRQTGDFARKVQFFSDVKT